MHQTRSEKSVRVTREMVAKAARDAGVRPGDTLMFHSSLSSMGAVVGGPDTIIDGFLDVLGPAGTLAVPTLCLWTEHEKDPSFSWWDRASSPSFVGAITEHFRKRPDAVRSDNATHSVAAIGARADELTAAHGAEGVRPGPFGERAFARSSPWQRLLEWNAMYGFIGVTFGVNTMVHFVETLIVERALGRAASDRRAALAAEVRGWMTPGVWPKIQGGDRELYEETLLQDGTERRVPLGAAMFRCCCAQPMVERWIRLLESDPHRWFPADFVEWLRRTGQAE